MRVVTLDTAKLLYDLVYYDSDQVEYFYVKQPWSDWSLTSNYIVNNESYPDGTDIMPAPRIDDLAYWIMQKTKTYIVPVLVDDVKVLWDVQITTVTDNGIQTYHLHEEFAVFDDAYECGVKHILNTGNIPSV